MLCNDNKVLTGSLAGQAYTLGVSPKIYRRVLVLTLLMSMLLVNWGIIVPLTVLYFVVVFCTPRYDSMYDSGSPKYDPSVCHW